MEESKGLRLTQEFRDVLDLLEKSTENLFITGKAGTGKSTLLQLFRRTTSKKILVLAPTGVAALNVRGQTIHSVFGLPPKIITKEEIWNKKIFSKKLFQNLDMIIIDEISMVRADVLDGIHWFLQRVRNNNEPFGGVRMALFGDLFQLPPVVSSNEERQFFSTRYSSPFFFSSDSYLHSENWETTELTYVLRQEERHFLRILEAIRHNSMDYDDLDDLNQRFVEEIELNGHIVLTSRNAAADKINSEKLASLNQKSLVYHAQVGGYFEPNLFPTEQLLTLKEGSQVMFLKNDQERRYVNGTIGTVYTLEEESITVSATNENGDPTFIKVEPFTWEIVKYKISDNLAEGFTSEVVGTFKQFPLKLAWAITIHKSQGKTFDNVIIDQGTGSFEHGQLYVALSRCRTLGGIILKQPVKPRDVIVDERIVEFYENLR
jgi:ATP-dependent DNA helicase PIF1